MVCLQQVMNEEESYNFHPYSYPHCANRSLLLIVSANFSKIKAESSVGLQVLFVMVTSTKLLLRSESGETLMA